jgi:hypothetical protein
MMLEDGTGRSDATSYGTLEGAERYHAARGNRLWTECTSVADKETALVRGADYLERAYARLWPGTRTTLRQRLSFPRYDVENLASNEIPIWLKEAQYEAAYLELIDPGMLSFDATEGGSITGEREGEMSRSYARAFSARSDFPRSTGFSRGISEAPPK